LSAIWLFIILKALSSLFSPVAMGLGAQTIMNWEIMSVGIQWSNVRNYTSPSAGKILSSAAQLCG